MSLFLSFFAAICRRKLEMPVEEVIRAVNALDLKTFSLENVEILQRMLPTEQEVFSSSIHLFITGDISMIETVIFKWDRTDFKMVICETISGKSIS